LPPIFSLRDTTTLTGFGYPKQVVAAAILHGRYQNPCRLFLDIKSESSLPPFCLGDTSTLTVFDFQKQSSLSNTVKFIVSPRQHGGSGDMLWMSKARACKSRGVYYLPTDLTAAFVFHFFRQKKIAHYFLTLLTTTGAHFRSSNVR
jgi:hypothetical protein